MAASRAQHAGRIETEQMAATPSRVGRRGLIAGAAALAAGLIAARTPEPVAATAGGTNGTALIIGANSDTGNTPNTYTAFTTTLRPTSGTTVLGTFSSGAALTGIGVDGREGLLGICYGQNAFGVEGETDTGIGVFGYAGSTTATTSYGVFARSLATAGYGVYGLADGTSAIGVYGTSSGTAPSVFGQNTGSATSSGPGAQGTSNLGHGTVGVSGASDGHAALYGFSNRSGGIALRASMDPMVRTAPFTFAGVFDGTVVISGSLFIGGNKSAYVPHPDGSHRVLYCEESTESWFADYGEGRLTNGKAEIALDPDFAALVETNTLHVFPVAHDEHPLHVAQRSASGFTVAATPDAAAYAKGKKATDLSGTFSYRVVAKRKDVKGERLARFVPPKELPFDAAKATTLPPSPPRKP
jgi:hypothetical protein